jgi:hypothetical protein
VPSKSNFADRDFEWKVYVPAGQVQKVLEECHASPLYPHFGIFKTLKLVKKTYYWPGIGKDVVDYVTRCETCKMIKSPNFINKLPLRPHSLPRRKFSVVAIDFATDLPRSKEGYTGFLVMVDLLTKYPWAFPMRRAEAGNMVKILKQKFLEFGVPSVVISDNGKQFVSKTYREFLEEWGIRSQTTPFYHPQANPAERIIRVIKTAIRGFVGENQKSWDEHLPEFLAGMRSVVHEATGQSPYFMTFGQEMYLTGKYLPYSTEDKGKVPEKEETLSLSRKIVKEARDKYLKAQKQWKTKYDKNAVVRQYNVGDEVFRRNFKQSNKMENYNAKLGKKWVKCVIVKDLKDGSYDVKDQNGKIGNHHSNNLRPASKICTRQKNKERNEDLKTDANLATIDKDYDENNEVTKEGGTAPLEVNCLTEFCETNKNSENKETGKPQNDEQSDAETVWDFLIGKLARFRKTQKSN